jgi:hypothetical protein
VLRGYQLHIPKTGGTALESVLGWHRLGHSTSLREAPTSDPIITIVRDPVARFVSAWDMVNQHQMKIAEGKYVRSYHTPDELEIDDAARLFPWLIKTFRYTFRPLTYWLESADFARERCWYIAHTETLDDDWHVIRDRLGLTGELPGHGELKRNETQGTTSVLSPGAEAAVRDFYAEDYELLRGLA